MTTILPELPTNLTRLFQALGSARSTTNEVDSKYVIVTPNQRLNRYLQSSYAQYQTVKGRKVWTALNCLPRSAWMTKLWQQIQLSSQHERASWRRLSAIQNKRLWQQVIDAHSTGWELLNPQQIQKHAIDAWQNLRLWQIPLEVLECYPTQLEEVQQLLIWIKAYQQACCEKQLNDDVDIQQCLLQCVQQGNLVLPKQIYLYGFESREPLFQSLLQAAQQHSSIVESVDFINADPVSVHRYIAHDNETELQHAARWSAAILEQDPTARIGVVVPELNSLHTKVERIFNEVFNPQYKQPGYKRHAPVFNMSAAQSLAQTPPIAAALSTLQLNRYEFAVDQIAGVFNSVFIGSEASLIAREALLETLQAEHQTLRSLQLRSLLTVAAENCENLKDFSLGISRFYGLARNKHNSRLSAFEWMEIFQAQLQALAWPGERLLDSLEYQQLAKWQDVLDEFISLDVIYQNADAEKLSLTEALDALKMASQQAFHAQTHDSPIQILGLLEAAGLEFDYLWLTQMDEQTWPPRSAANPLLPSQLQQQHAMPRASSAGELQYAQNLTQRLLSSAKHLIFSYAKQGQSEELQASPLIKHFPVINELQLADVYNTSSEHLDVLTDDAVEPLPAEHAIGGTHILKDYAACPFKAFARYRLHAQKAEIYESGITALDRGNLLHQSLDNLWYRLKDLNALLQLSYEDEVTLVQEVVEAAWRRVFSAKDIGRKLRELELARTQNIIHAWLKLEKQRQHFVVVEREGAHETPIGPMTLRMRYDRMDQLDDSTVVVIDYKSSNTKTINDWASQRPNEPQVPLYALANKTNVGAAAFGLVSARKTAFEGLALSDGIAPGLKTPDDRFQKSLPQTWEDILAQWEEVLTQLATDWVEGKVPVDPKNGAQTCKHCDLQSLCRINISV